MAWDTEATRRRLLDAGARQFAERGFAGTTLDAISRDAGVNKERVYQYFGDKRAFFGAVLTDRLSDLLDDLPVADDGPSGVGAYAGALFDRYQQSPDLPRLLAWESLELPGVAAAERRAAMCAAGVSCLQQAMPTADTTRVEHVLLSVVTLVTGWWTLAHLGGAILTGDTSPSARRARLVAQAEHLAAT